MSKSNGREFQSPHDYYETSPERLKNELAAIHMMMVASKHDHYYDIKISTQQLESLLGACDLLLSLKSGQLAPIVRNIPLKQDCNLFALIHDLEGLFRPLMRQSQLDLSLLTIRKILIDQLNSDQSSEINGCVIEKSISKLVVMPALKQELSQDIFIHQPSSIKSAYINENGHAYISECAKENLSIQHGCYVGQLGLNSYFIGSEYNNDRWRASAINRFSQL